MIRQLPNALTGLRVLSAPVLAAFLLYKHYTSAFLVFTFAGFTDLADGFLAKRFGLVTRVGRYLDPAADKLLMLTALLALSTIHESPAWLALIVIGRDVNIVIAIIAARMLALPLRIQPLAIGKVCTAVQVAYVAMVLFLLALRIEAPATLHAAALIAAVFTVASWLAYAVRWFRAFAARPRGAIQAE